MHALHTILAAAFILGGVSLAQAENRIFIISNNPDGYGVDRCLAAGAACGSPFATTYCQTHEFVKAISFRRVDRSEITGAIPRHAACNRSNCEEFVAIECAR